MRYATRCEYYCAACPHELPSATFLNNRSDDATIFLKQIDKFAFILYGYAALIKAIHIPGNQRIAD